MRCSIENQALTHQSNAQSIEIHDEKICRIRRVGLRVLSALARTHITYARWVEYLKTLVWSTILWALPHLRFLRFYKRDMRPTILDVLRWEKSLQIAHAGDKQYAREWIQSKRQTEI